MRETIEEQNQHIGRLMEDFVRRAVEFSNTLPDRPIRQPDPQEVMDYLQGEAIPAQGRPLEEVYGEMLEDVYRDILFPQHPRSFACIPSTASLLSWMGDVMTNAFNPHANCQVNAPAANLIEKKLIDWMCGLAGYPQGSGGLFVSGGSIANLTALTGPGGPGTAGGQPRVAGGLSRPLWHCQLPVRPRQGGAGRHLGPDKPGDGQRSNGHRLCPGIHHPAAGPHRAAAMRHQSPHHSGRCASDDPAAGEHPSGGAGTPPGRGEGPAGGMRQQKTAQRLPCRFPF